MYEADFKGGRPSIALEKLLRAMLLQIFYSVRCERQLMKQTRYNLLFRWFIGLAMGFTPHVVQNTPGRRSVLPDEIAISLGYAISQNKRKLIGEGFGWAKTVGRTRQGDGA